MKTILYLGTDPKHFLEYHTECTLIHYPVIRIVPRKVDESQVQQAYMDLPFYTHVLFTSKNAVHVFFEHLCLLHYDKQQIKDKILIAIGAATAQALHHFLRLPDWIAQEETQEGVIDLLKEYSLENAYVLFPRSSLSRPMLTAYLQSRKVLFRAFDLYDTVVQRLEPIPDLDQCDEIIFTSPSTVKGFIHIFGKLPKDKLLHALGPITAATLAK